MYRKKCIYKKSKEGKREKKRKAHFTLHKIYFLQNINLVLRKILDTVQTIIYNIMLKFQL